MGFLGGMCLAFSELYGNDFRDGSGLRVPARRLRDTEHRQAQQGRPSPPPGDDLGEPGAPARPRRAGLAAERWRRRDISDPVTQLTGRPPPPRRRGSRTSRSASPSMLKPKTAREMAAPGQMAIHGARYMNERPEPESIAPHEGEGGGTPKPRKESADSARIAAPRPMVARMMIVAATLGSR